MRNEKGQYMKGNIPECGFKKGRKGIRTRGRTSMKNGEKQKEAVRNYMKNRIVSDETRLKMGLATKKRLAEKGHPMQGKKIAYKARYSYNTKATNPAWKGGTQTQSHMDRVKFRKTIQKEVLKRDNYTCQICGDRGVELHVDHIQAWADYVELRFSMNNCRTLCKPCHYLITFGREIPDVKLRWGIGGKLE